MAKTLTKLFISAQRKRLEEEEKKTLRQIEELRQEDPFSNPDHASDNAAVDTDVREQVGHDTIEAQIKDMEKRIQHIDLALRKTSKNRYGQCDKCGGMIPVERLELVPEALFCIECEKKLHK